MNAACASNDTSRGTGKHQHRVIGTPLTPGTAKLILKVHSSSTNHGLSFPDLWQICMSFNWKIEPRRGKKKKSTKTLQKKTPKARNRFQQGCSVSVSSPHPQPCTSAHHFMSKVKGFSSCCLPQRAYRGFKDATGSSLLLDSWTLGQDKSTPVRPIGCWSPSAFDSPTATNTETSTSHPRALHLAGKKLWGADNCTAMKKMRNEPWRCPPHCFPRPLPAQPCGRWSTTFAVSLPASTTMWYSCCQSRQSRS